MESYELVIDFPTHIDSGLLDHFWVRKDLIDSFDLKIHRKCVNISDHDAVKISITLKSHK